MSIFPRTQRFELGCLRTNLRNFDLLSDESYVMPSVSTGGRGGRTIFPTTRLLNTIDCFPPIVGILYVTPCTTVLEPLLPVQPADYLKGLL